MSNYKPIYIHTPLSYRCPTGTPLEYNVALFIIRRGLMPQGEIVDSVVFKRDY